MQKQLFRILAVLWTIFMSFFLLVPGGQLRSFWFFKHMDKLAHFSVFFIWSVLVTLALEIGEHSKNVYWKVIGGAIIFGGTVEIAQYFIPDRKADLFDMFMNVAGAILGFFAAEFLKKELFDTGKKFD